MPEYGLWKPAYGQDQRYIYLSFSYLLNVDAHGNKEYAELFPGDEVILQGDPEAHIVLYFYNLYNQKRGTGGWW